MENTLGAGLGLKAEHFDLACANRAPGLWFEVHAENHLVDGGPRLAWLEAVRAHHPVALHGVSMSLAGATPPDPDHLKRLARLVQRIQPALVSEHLAWSRFGAHYAPDLLPFVRSTTMLKQIAANLVQLQDHLQRRVAIENPTHYLQLEGHDWDEPGFLTELVRRSGCGLLVDVNNVFVSAHNTGTDPRQWLDGIPHGAVMEIHLAGHQPDNSPLSGLLIDSHDAPVAEPVWQLYQRLLEHTGHRPTLIERDGNIPPFEALMAERDRAHRVLTAEEGVTA